LGAYGIEARESAALRQWRTVTTAEVSYAVAFANLGFTCTLAHLGGSGGGQPNPHAAQKIDETLAEGSADGYAFSLTDCSGSPVNPFRAVAAPANADLGLRAFCADESGVIRYAEGRTGEHLPARGQTTALGSGGHLCADAGAQFLDDFKSRSPRLFGLGHIE
jgi:hypothetical protein